MLDINGIGWVADSFQLWSQPFPPNSPLIVRKHLVSSVSLCWKLAASGWRQWWDLGNNCYSRLRMEMRMTVDWQSTLLGGLSSLSSIKVKLWRRNDSMWWAYVAWTCWVHTDLFVISRSTGCGAFATENQILSSVWLVNDAFKNTETLNNGNFSILFYLIYLKNVILPWRCK